MEEGAEVFAGVADEGAGDLGDEVELGGLVLLRFAEAGEELAENRGGKAEGYPAFEAAADGDVAGAGELGREPEFETGRLEVGGPAADGLKVVGDDADEDGELLLGLEGGAHGEEEPGSRETSTRERCWFHVMGRM